MNIYASEIMLGEINSLVKIQDMMIKQCVPALTLTELVEHTNEAVYVHALAYEQYITSARIDNEE